MILKIVTPNQVEIKHESVEYVNLRLSDGNPISIYPKHIELIGLIQEGRIHYVSANQRNDISISTGLLVVKNDIITCFVNWAFANKTKIDDHK